MDLHGTIHGETIQLDEPMPGMDGKRVRVHVDLLDETDIALSEADNRRAWTSWVAAGPQGPIEVEDDSWP